MILKFNEKFKAPNNHKTSHPVYLLRVGLHHDVAVDKDGADDGEREEGVGEHMDGDPGSAGVRIALNNREVLPSNWVKG